MATMLGGKRGGKFVANAMRHSRSDWKLFRTIVFSGGALYITARLFALLRVVLCCRPWREGLPRLSWTAPREDEGAKAEAGDGEIRDTSARDSTLRQRRREPVG